MKLKKKNKPPNKPTSIFSMQSAHSTYLICCYLFVHTKNKNIGSLKANHIHYLSLWFPFPFTKRKKNHLEYIVVFNSIEIPWLLVSLWSILLDLVVYMRNDRPSQHTNLSFSCVPTWFKWHVNPANMWIQNNMNVNECIDGLVLRTKSKNLSIILIAPLYTTHHSQWHCIWALHSACWSLKCAWYCHSNLSIHYFHAKKSIGQYPLACVSLETLIIIINSSRSEMSRNWWIWNYQQKYANHHKYSSETNCKIQQ